MHKMRMMPELTPGEARRVKAAHIVAGAGLFALVVTQLTFTATMSFRKGLRAGERRTLRRLVEGEALEDIVEHRGGRRCCVQGHHHKGCCIHDGEHGHHGMHGMMHGSDTAAEGEAQA